MFVDFLYELRRRGLRVGPQEARTLAEALERELHGSTLDGFYQVARALCVHREQDLDGFDRAFAHHFRDAPDDALALTDELASWLQDAMPARELSAEQRALLESLDLEEVRKRLRERLAEQKERHDGGSRWVGTGGTSPFGRGGQHPSGIRLGDGSGAGGALALAGARRFKDLRGDVTLDTRQIEQALRRLRAFVREGAQHELDLPGTIDATARGAGELDVKLRAPRRSSLRVLLLLDVGGSMDPHAAVSERLFSAARRATHFKELRTYFFHNCIYGRVYDSPRLSSGVPLPELLRSCDPHWRLLVVGDALMNPAELRWSDDLWGWSGPAGAEQAPPASGLDWLVRLAEHFDHAAWLNPEPEVAWHGTAEVIARIYPMFRLTLDGLQDAIVHLLRGGPGRAARGR